MADAIKITISTMCLEKFPGNDDRLSGQMQKLVKPLEMAHSALGTLKYENVYRELFLIMSSMYLRYPTISCCCDFLTINFVVTSSKKSHLAADEARETKNGMALKSSQIFKNLD